MNRAGGSWHCHEARSSFGWEADNVVAMISGGYTLEQITRARTRLIVILVEGTGYAETKEYFRKAKKEGLVLLIDTTITSIMKNRLPLQAILWQWNRTVRQCLALTCCCRCRRKNDIGHFRYKHDANQIYGVYEYDPTLHDINDLNFGYVEPYPSIPSGNLYQE